MLSLNIGKPLNDLIAIRNACDKAINALQGVSESPRVGRPPLTTKKVIMRKPMRRTNASFHAGTHLLRLMADGRERLIEEMEKWFKDSGLISEAQARNSARMISSAANALTRSGKLIKHGKKKDARYRITELNLVKT